MYFTFIPNKVERNENLWGKKSKVIFSNSFYFLFSKTCFREYKKKKKSYIFEIKKHVWLVEIRKIVFWRKKNRKY